MELSCVCHVPLQFPLELSICPQEGGLNCISVVMQGNWVFYPEILCVIVRLLAVGICFSMGGLLAL